MFIYLNDRSLSDNNVEIIKSIGAKLDYKENEDIVYLIGDKSKDSNIYYENLYLVVSNAETGEVSNIKINKVGGYNPQIYISDFNGDGVDEIFVTSNNGGSGGYINANIYSGIGGKLKEIFNVDTLNNSSNYKVEFKDEYIVKLTDELDNKEYLMDISLRDKKYINEIYTEKGKLKKIFMGEVLSVGGIYTLDLDSDNITKILAVQRVIGLYNADTLGYINSVLKFDNIDYKVIMKAFSIEGVSRCCSRCYKSFEKDIIKNKYSIDFSRVNFIEAEKVKDYKIERALEKEYNIKPGIDKVSYLYNKVNLNDNNNNNVMVYIEGPRFCENNGCTLVILESNGEEYRVLSKIVGSSNPIIISDEKTNGYRNIIMKTESSLGEGVYKELKFNGNSYPGTLNNEPRVRKGNKVQGIAVIADDLFYVKGIEV